MRFKGIVVKGKGRGAKMGFPTINLELAQALPNFDKQNLGGQEGIYAALVKIGKRILPAAGFVGAAKTFGEKEKRVEAHIFDFNENLLGKKVEVVFFKRIRGNKKFKSEKELAAQIRKDGEAARNFFRGLTG